MPPGSELVVIDNALATVIDSIAVPDAPFISVAFTVNENVPLCVGFPLMTPPVLSVKPPGSAPLASVHI